MASDTELDADRSISERIRTEKKKDDQILQIDIIPSSDESESETESESESDSNDKTDLDSLETIENGKKNRTSVKNTKDDTFQNDTDSDTIENNSDRNEDDDYVEASDKIDHQKLNDRKKGKGGRFIGTKVVETRSLRKGRGKKEIIDYSSSSGSEQEYMDVSTSKKNKNKNKKKSQDHEDDEDEGQEQEDEEEETDDESDTSNNSYSSNDSSIDGSICTAPDRPKEYWAERKKKFVLDMDPKFAKQRDKADMYLVFKFLLGITDLFRHFISIKGKHDKNIQKLLKNYTPDTENENDSNSKTSTNSSANSSQEPIENNKNKNTSRIRSSSSSRYHHKSEKEEDAELIAEEEDDSIDNFTEETYVTESPSFVQAGCLRDYQVRGLNWLISLHEHHLSGILADEMGLGKTLQTIAFLGYLRYVKQIDGPFLIVVPKSTLDNWRREFYKWTPNVNVVILHGNKVERNDIIHNVILQARFDVIVTSYEIVIREKNALKKIAWKYIVIDEAHRIKNEQSALSQIIRLFYSKNRLLITGTPLQNNLHELWALLNFLLPDVFGDSAVFDEWFQQNNSDQDQEVVVQQLHTVLNPFLLRRIKADVEKSLLPKIETNLYVGMTEMQIHWYKLLLEKDIGAVNGAVGKREGKTRLLNIAMQLRKCCNHPYLFEGAEPGPPFTTDEHLIYNAGKMIVLDKLLTRLRKNGSRVLIFSQMSRLLDILEDYCFFKDINYCRIDGSTAHEERIEAIDSFNRPDSDKFVFLLTTRAGGLGINLVTADTVILYDSDWNPQADLQATDRAHRIGQKKQVHVYRFLTENAIEEKIIERAAQKLRLDQLVIQQGAGKKTATIGNSKDDLLDMIQYGAKNMFEDQASKITIDDDIEEILKKGEQKTNELKVKYQSLGLDDLQKFNSIENQSSYEWNGQKFEQKSNDTVTEWINPSKRERRREQPTYSVDEYYKDIIGNASKTPKQPIQPKAPRPPKIIHGQDFQFLPKKLDILQDKEQLYFKRKVNYRVTSYDVAGSRKGDNSDSEDGEGEGDGDGDEENENGDRNDVADEEEENEKDNVDENENASESENSEEENENGNKKESKSGKKQENNGSVSSEYDSLDRNEEIKLRVKKEQNRIDNAPEFTEEDGIEKQELVSEGFINWSKREFITFINASAKYGRDNMSMIRESIESKTGDEVDTYVKVFWRRYKEVQGWKKYLSIIEVGENKNKRLENQEYLLRKKIEDSKYSLHHLSIQYPPNNTRKTYSVLEDKFILLAVNKHGLRAERLYEKIKQEIMLSDLFTFDWFIRTRSLHELSKRVNTLMNLVMREHEQPEQNKKKRNRVSAIKEDATVTEIKKKSRNEGVIDIPDESGGENNTNDNTNDNVNNNGSNNGSNNTKSTNTPKSTNNIIHMHDQTRITLPSLSSLAILTDQPEYPNKKPRTEIE